MGPITNPKSFMKETGGRFGNTLGRSPQMSMQANVGAVRMAQMQDTQR